MNNIVQMSESDYNNLVGKAELNDKQILSKAKEMWRKKGSYSLEVEMRFNSKNDYSYSRSIEFKPYSYVKDWDNDSCSSKCFPLTEEQKRAAVKFVNERLSSFMQDKFGKQITDLNAVKEVRKKQEQFLLKTKIITMTGWLMALAMFIAIIIF